MYATSVEKMFVARTARVRVLYRSVIVTTYWLPETFRSNGPTMSFAINLSAPRSENLRKRRWCLNLVPMIGTLDNVRLYYIHQWTYSANNIHVLMCRTTGSLLSGQQGLSSGPNVEWWNALIASRLCARSRVSAKVLPRVRSCRNKKKNRVSPLVVEDCDNMRLSLAHSWTQLELITVGRLYECDTILECNPRLCWVSFMRLWRRPLLGSRCWIRNHPYPSSEVAIMGKLPGIWHQADALCLSRAS